MYRYPVCVVKATKALSDAIHFHKELPSDENVRSFLDKYTTKLVSIILRGLNLGDVDLSQKDAIRSCLKLVLDLVRKDLKVASRQACEDKSVCPTFSALAEILDDAEGYNEDDRSSLLDTFFMEKGLRYLSGYVGLSLNDFYPQLDHMNTIMKFLIGSSVLNSSTNCCVEVAQRTMFHLAFRRCCDENLIRLGDDIFDISKTVMHLYNHDVLTRCDAHDLSFLLNNHLNFLSRAMKSTSSTECVKFTGLLELSALIEAVRKMRPLPRAYIVSESGADEIDGIYVIDPEKTTDDGILKDVTDVRYVRVGREEKETEINNAIYLGPNKSADIRFWYIYRIEIVQEDRQHIYYSAYVGDRFELRRPHLVKWNKSRPYGDGFPTAFVRPIGFIQTKQLMFNTLEHILLKKITEVIDDVADCAQSDDDSVYIEVKHIFGLIQEIIEQMLDLMTRDIKLLVDLGTEVNTFFSTKAIDKHHEAVNALMHHLAHGLRHRGLKLFSTSFIEKTCRQLEEFHEQSSLLDSHCLFDSQIFLGLMSLRLLGFPRGSELSELGHDLKNKAQYFYSDKALLESSSSMATTQQNILSRMEPLFNAAQTILLLRKNRYSLSWDEPERKEAVINIKQKLRDSLSSLDVSSPEAEDMSDLHAGFVKNMLNILRDLYINITMNSPENIADFHEFHLACIMKLIMSSNEKLRSKGWTFLHSKIRIEQQVADVQEVVLSYRVESLDFRDKNAAGVYSVDQIYLIKKSWTDGVVCLLYVKGPMSVDCLNDTDDTTCHYLLMSPHGEGPYLIKKAVGDVITDTLETQSVTPLESKMTSAQEFALWAIENKIIKRARKARANTHALCCYYELKRFVRDICAKEEGVDKPVTNMIHQQETKMLARMLKGKRTSDAIVGASNPITEKAHETESWMVEEQKVNNSRRSKRLRISETTQGGADNAVNNMVNESISNSQEAHDLEIGAQDVKKPRRSKRKRKTDTS
jgi:hypothetical protein